MESSRESGGSRYPRLRSMLPKVLLYDNVSLNKQLHQVITNLSIEEKKASYSWTQLQKRFITQQALKQESRGMRLLPAIQQDATEKQPIAARASYSAPTSERMTESASSKPRLSVPSCHSAVGKLDRERAFIGTERRPRRKSHPVRDGRFLRLYRLLSDVKLDPHVKHDEDLMAFELIRIN